MKRDDHILAITTGFLTMPDKILDNAFVHFSDRYELGTLKKKGTVSIGGRTTDGEEKGFIEWITSMRKQGIANIQLVRTASSGALPSHVASAFSGNLEFVLNIITSQGCKAFILSTSFSPQFEITAQQFVQLIDAQNRHEKLWPRIAELVLESNRLNNRSSFPSQDIRQYLLTEEAAPVFDLLLSQLIHEVQIECVINDVTFSIPIALKNLFYQTNFSTEASTVEPVFLYPVKDLSPGALLQLVEAQPFAHEIWNACSVEVTRFPQPELPAQSPRDLTNSITSLNSSALSSLVHIVCRTICNLCEEKKLTPVIPEHLKAYLGPNELEAKRARVRSRFNKDQWFLESNKNPWQLYFFEQIQDVVVPENTNGVLPKKAFQDALQKIADFARSIQSPFEEAFLLGLFFLNEKFPPGNYDNPHNKKIISTLKKKKFSDMAQENIQHTLSYSKDWMIFGWPPEKINGLHAISIADVFGGMGSWNDIFIENDYETYQQVSAETYKALKNYMAAILS